MHIRIIAVGSRQPDWVAAAFDAYVKRLPEHWRFRLETVTAGPRSSDNDARKAADGEGDKILRRIKPLDQVVVLDERGKELSSVELAAKLDGWQRNGRDLSFVLGGPDGLSARCVERADFRWSLSRLTLPHGLARVLLAEQLYRAHTVTTGHPYHRA